MEHQLLTYIIAITLLTLTPGVDTLVVVRNASRGGWQDGALTSLGICSGLFVHATASAIGISVILLQSALAFSLLKFVGATYLIWLGFASLSKAVSRKNEPNTDILATKNETFQLRRSFQEGFLSNVLNPKTIIFYMAFLPQFIDPTHSSLRQSLQLAGFHFGIAMAWQCLLALMVIQAKGWFKNSKIGVFFEWLSGSVLILLGLKLAINR